MYICKYIRPKKNYN